MTTNVTVDVNGRYKAIVTQDGGEPVEVHGRYSGSPNPGGSRTFHLPHPATGTFVVTEEEVPAEAAPVAGAAEA